MSREYVCAFGDCTNVIESGKGVTVSRDRETTRLCSWRCAIDFAQREWLREVDRKVEAVRLKPGQPCRCESCEIERAGTGAIYKAEIFCPSCGHGVIDMRTGRADDANMGCPKCRHKAGWLETKPTFDALKATEPVNV